MSIQAEREKAVDLVEDFIEAVTRYDRDTKNHAYQADYFTKREELINALIAVKVGAAS